MSLDRDKLQKTLRNLDSVDYIDLAKLMNMGVDDLLIAIDKEIVQEYKAIYKKNAYKIAFYNKEKTKEFFTSQIIDLGMLCQHVIKDIKETLKDEHNKFGHVAFHSAWLLNRGY